METFYRGFSTVNTALQKIEKFLGCVTLAALFAIMISNAALRYLFDSGLNWSDEFNGFLFVWFGFLAGTYAMSTDSHLRITAFIGMFPRTVQYALRMVMDVIMIVMFLIYMEPLGNLLRTLPISNVLRWPMKYVCAILPLSFGAMCFHILFNMVGETRTFLREKKGLGEEESA